MKRYPRRSKGRSVRARSYVGPGGFEAIGVVIRPYFVLPVSFGAWLRLALLTDCWGSTLGGLFAIPHRGGLHSLCYPEIVRSYAATCLSDQKQSIECGLFLHSEMEAPPLCNILCIKYT